MGDALVVVGIVGIVAMIILGACRTQREIAWCAEAGGVLVQGMTRDVCLDRAVEIPRLHSGGPHGR